MTIRRLFWASGIVLCTAAVGCGSSGSGNSGTGGSAGSAGSGTGGTAGASTGGTGGSATGGNGGTSSGGTGGSAAGGTGGTSTGGTGGTGGSAGNHVKTVFLIMMENHNWSAIKGSSSAPYINKTLLPMSSYATNYQNPPGNHPSEPNYIWLEAGSNLGITNDANPSSNHQSTTKHLARQLKDANVSWKAYQEDISGKVCPLTGVAKYAPKHDPFIYFDDMTGNLSATDPYCIAHNRPYTELATDIANNTVPRYAFITPNLCNDMHNTCAPQNNSVKQGDDWLKSEVPKILASKAYKDNGALFITWDESEGGDVPIGMIVLSPLAKGGGYTSNIKYTHSSTLRTFQEIFGVSPFLGDAAKATDLGDLFKSFP